MLLIIGDAKPRVLGRTRHCPRPRGSIGAGVVTQHGSLVTAPRMIQAAVSRGVGKKVKKIKCHRRKMEKMKGE